MKKLILLLSFFIFTMAASADDLTAIVTNTPTGLSAGSIDLTVSGGIAPFTYSWVGPNGMKASTEDINNLAAGTYSVTVTDKYCGVATLTVNITTNTTGIAGIDGNATIVLSPNPADDVLRIYSASAFQKASVRLMSINGKTIQQTENLSGTDFNLDVSALSSGIYFVEVYTDQVISRNKFIKK